MRRAVVKPSRWRSGWRPRILMVTAWGSGMKKRLWGRRWATRAPTRSRKTRPDGQARVSGSEEEEEGSALEVSFRVVGEPLNASQPWKELVEEDSHEIVNSRAAQRRAIRTELHDVAKTEVDARRCATLRETRTREDRDEGPRHESRASQESVEKRGRVMTTAASFSPTTATRCRSRHSRSSSRR